MRMSHLFLCLLTVATLAPSSAGAQPRAQFPIGYVSMQRLLSESDDAKAAAKELEAMRAARQQELNVKKQALDATRLEAANAGGIFSRSRHAELVERAAREESELQRAAKQAETEFQGLQKQVQERLRTELNGILTRMALERGLAYVLNQDTAIVLAPAAANLTADVLARMNAAHAERLKATSAQPPPPTTAR
jgi:outer membrane protein